LLQKKFTKIVNSKKNYFNNQQTKEK